MDKNPEVIRNAEPFFIKGGPVGCLLLHGFTGTPFEMRLLARSLAPEGYTIMAPRLFGHATDPRDMLRARWWDWIGNVEDSLNILKGCTDRQVLLGLSMGGILTMLAAARYKIDAAVSFSTPYSLPEDPRIKYLRWLYWLAPQQGKGKPDWHNSEAIKDHIDYPYFPTRSIIELQLLLKAMQEDLHNVKVPVLFAQSHGDHTIPPESMNTLYDRISSTHKSRLWVDDSGHVIIREPEREKIFTATKEFLKQVLAQK
ncbi:MAG: alpha/beta hydrolase [Anaerolineaceae bacterium]